MVSKFDNKAKKRLQSLQNKIALIIFKSIQQVPLNLKKFIEDANTIGTICTFISPICDADKNLSLPSD